jgi:hypothetical protein
MTTVFRTAPTAAALHPSGVARLPSGAWVTRLPLVDSAAPPLFARLTYRDAQSAAARLSGRLPTREEIVSLISAGHIITPTTLSWGPEMVGRGHAETHDASVAAKLEATRWDGVRPVMGAGKWWTGGATGENVRICGWWDGEKLIQSGLALDNPHHLGAAQSHVDYGTLCAVAFDAEPASAEPHGHELAPRSLGLRALDVARGYVGLQERPGPQHDTTIQGFLGGCRRGGSPTAGMGDDRTGGVTLGPRAPDETEWCCATATTCVAEALLDGDEAPCGRRAACWEVIADARKTGRWHDVGSGYVPKDGDLEVEGRAGGDPRIPGQPGHIGIRWGARRVDGNSANSMRVVTGGGPKVVGWIQVSATLAAAEIGGVDTHRDDLLAVAIDRQAREAIG